jgi:chorismate mutase
VKERFGMEVATEVATPEHVEAAMNAGMDYLWIGARTSANPMAVSAIASTISKIKYASERVPAPSETGRHSLKGILIKNPVNADAGLWIGNIERLEKTGVPVIAVHRGCGHKPCWAMAHEVRMKKPDIPMLLDPSHMSGDAAKVPGLMGKIAELGLDGAMIEVHYRPEEALSDAQQQITPSVLAEIIPFGGAGDDAKRENSELNWLRAEIDELDEGLWDTIAARMDVSKRIGEWKKAHGVAPLQPERYENIVENLKLKVKRLGLSEKFAMQIWDMIHEESIKQQQ